MKELQTLRALVADLKAAPVYLKASRAEKTIDAAVACIDALNARVSQLEERAGLNNGNGQQ